MSRRKVMRTWCAAVMVLAVTASRGFERIVSAQVSPVGSTPLVGTWQLVALERATPTQPLSPVANPVGMLIQDASGHVIEIITRAARPATLNAAEVFTTYAAYWGTYTIDSRQSTVAYQIEGDLDPGRARQRFVRSFERKGDRLVLSELSPEGRPVSRTTWARIPELEALPAYQEGVVGFWRWKASGLVNSSGANVQEAVRDASVIVYTPTGHMAVLYLPPPGRKPFEGPVPTVDEARAAMQGSVSYFGTYIVQPRSRAVFHYQLAAANPTAVGGSFMRNFEINGTQVTLRFPPTTRNGEQVQNVLTLERLSGLTDMWPEFRR
jgi:lipocalin-like protein